MGPPAAPYPPSVPALAQSAPPAAPLPRQAPVPLAPTAPDDDLGPLIREYRPRRWALRLAIAAGIFLTGVAIIVYSINTREIIERRIDDSDRIRRSVQYTVPAGIRSAGDWMAVLGAFATLYYLGWTLRALNLRAAVHERGLVYRRWFRQVASPWAEISQVYYARQRQRLLFSWTTYYCRVVRRDGGSITLPSQLTKLIAGMGGTHEGNLIRLGYSIFVHVFFRNPLPGMAELCNAIRGQAAAAQLPKVWQALQRGEKVGLGELLAMGPAGLTHGNAVLPWGELEQISVGGGVGVSAGAIRFRRRGAEALWLVVHSSALANRDVLLEVARRYRVPVENLDGDDVRPAA
jgi:hypothetical protein